ncbi:MAG: permease-like cell division protein FtsX [Candidatus Liptonbacteria bacterium]
MLTILSRIINYGFNNFKRNGWPSAATVLTMTLVLLGSFGLIMFNVLMKSAVSSIQDKINITVFFKTNTPEDQILGMKQSLESLQEVRDVEYISSEQALDIFKERHKDDPVISETVNELSVNPLEPSLNIRANTPDEYPKIADYLNAPNLKENYDKVTYFENQDVIDRLIKIVSTVNKGGLLFTIILAIIAGLVVFNTIQLAIYSMRDEIGIMRAVGASNMLVRGPFIVEGVIAGLIAAIVSIIAAAPIVYFISPYIAIFIPGFGMFQYFYTHLFSLLFYQIILAVVIGSISSFFAVRRYLRN